MAKKVIGIDTILYLLDGDNKTFKYTVVDIGVYLTDDGVYRPGFILSNDCGSTDFEDYYTIRHLLDVGIMWIEGHEQMAEFLRRK